MTAIEAAIAMQMPRRQVGEIVKAAPATEPDEIVGRRPHDGFTFQQRQDESVRQLLAVLEPDQLRTDIKKEFEQWTCGRN